MNTTHRVKLDKEWIVLLQTAKMMGISPEEIKQYLRHATTKQSQSNNEFHGNTHDNISELLTT